jgi:NitT/TauT family transport system substrate-binding protein
MSRSTTMRLIACCAMLAFAAPARAEDIVISNYGVSANGMPFAVALARGYFQQEGANVTGILSSAGGGTTLRNMLAGSAPYAEVNPNAVIAAIQQGADIRIVSDNVLTVAEFVWAVKPESTIRTVADLKGRKIGYTNPRSTSQALATMVLESGGLKTSDATLVKTGGFGEGVAALDIGIVDAAPIPEPLWSKFKGKYRAIARAA